MTGWHDLPQLARLLAALAFVIALMGGLSLILKRIGVPGAVNMPGYKKRLKVIESLSLDPRRRAVLIQCDHKQHLVILGTNSETVVETNIVPVEEIEKNVL